MNESEYAKLYCTIANNSFDGHTNKAFGWWSQQDPHDLGGLVKRVSKIKPKKILEIGANHGGTLIFWDYVVGPEGCVVGIDSGPAARIFSMFDSGYCDYEPVSELHTIPRSSHEDETFQVVKTLLDGSIDFLFMDGDQTSEGLRLDYEMYGSLVREGGMIAISAIATASTIGSFWDGLEVSKDYTSARETRIGVITK